MIKKNYALTSALIFLLLPFSGYGIGAIADDLLLFRKVAEKLNTIKTISYHYRRELTYPSDSYHSKSEGEMYVDFGKENDLVGFRYQYRDSVGFSIFNNAEIFDGRIRKKTIKIENKLNKSSLDGRAMIHNSIITLRNILSSVLDDDHIIKKVSDTTIANKSYYLLSFETHNKYPDYLGTGFSATDQEVTFYNSVIVNKETLLPLTFLQSKQGRDDLHRTDFTKINLNPALPAEKSWYYSTYLNEYKPENQHPAILIKAGQVAPDFSLTNKENGLKETLSKYHGHVILLEFWIKNCGYCIEAVPKLNVLNKKYKSENFKILGVNTQDNENSIADFITKNKVEFSVLWGADADVNINYGVAAFPQVVLIDKTGVVMYSGVLDPQKIMELIDQSI